MIKFLFLIVFIISFSSLTFADIIGGPYTTQDDKINQRDVNGKKTGKWIYYGKDRPEEGYPMEGKIEEGPYKEDRKEGIWIKYHSDGVTPKLKGMYINNRPKGGYTKYFPNGKPKNGLLLVNHLAKPCFSVVIVSPFHG